MARKGGSALRRARAWLPGLLLVTPSIIAIGVFVYGMLGWNFSLAMTDKHDEVSEGNFVGLQNFVDIWDEPRWHLSVNHAILFTVVFVLGALVLGWFLAFLMEKGIRGEGTFRAIYLFPMAISFVATGIVWRWLMNSGQDERAVGLNRLFDVVGPASVGLVQGPGLGHGRHGDPRHLADVRICHGTLPRRVQRHP
ncbi:sugar ABC transporter permease [Nonomuraea dietziae]|uniref:carbohydrate ABC transporter permease n=1 Tax=Nonomuraea dietziae TaxID=65515 RepID=UPI0031D868EE